MRAKLMLVIGLLYLSCTVDRIPPDPPKGLYSITGDGRVTITWLPNDEPDLAGYRVYRSYSPEGPYNYIGSTNVEFYIDEDVTNGVTYFYTVTAYDVNGNESPPSDEVVYDTPRPEGSGLVLFDCSVHPEYAGYDFSSESIVNCGYPLVDFYIMYDGEVLYLYAGYDALIQDFGYITTLDEIDYAPLNGWSPTGRAEVIEGHGYIIWTWDNHFAKLRVDNVGDGWVELSWAYQVDEGNRELSIGKELQTLRR